MGAEEVRPPGGQGLGDDDGWVHIRSFPFGAEDRAGCPTLSATALGCERRRLQAGGCDHGWGWGEIVAALLPIQGSRANQAVFAGATVQRGGSGSADAS